ncbi:kelch domain-containing [Micractinium conductrix]|uniref:Kelch domain-containing n=1 Tax=Micractinium conductrix TaxID=554055 RepID=A0A2P6V2Z7_9CHLO|nr:kelch domain-containing [Micractinium conductrix]|eukprot:PSC68470.1 kelch domain-containing [Micractinium conductrix]
MARSSALATVVAALVLATSAVAASEGGRKLQGSESTFYVPAGGKGTFQNGIPTGVILIFANLMKDGNVVGWSNGYKDGRWNQWGTVSDWTEAKHATKKLAGCGMHGALPGTKQCTTAFCSGMATTHKNELVSFGGHLGPGLGTMKHYIPRTGQVITSVMGTKRWYPGTVTLPDERVMVIGGVTRTAATECNSNRAYNNPTYNIYDPNTRILSGLKWDMREQFDKAHPFVAYPVVTVTPDGGLVVAAGDTMYKYKRCRPENWCKEYEMQPRPGGVWTYPNTGTGLPLPMYPPYTKMELFAAGGSTVRCPKNFNTPASTKAHVIEITAGKKAKWRRLPDMPHPRMMPDSVYLADGTIFITNGGKKGRAGWCKGPFTYKLRDKGTYNCGSFCTCATGWNYEPAIFDPVSSKWTRAGSLAEGKSLRLYHSSATLLPSGKVMLAGSDVTIGDYAELYSPPYLNRGRRPAITKWPQSHRTNLRNPNPTNLTVTYASPEKIAKAILIRAGSQTHSTLFDGRALWLKVVADNRRASGDTLTLQIPACSTRPPVGCNIVPPGMYMLFLHNVNGAGPRRKLQGTAFIPRGGKGAWANGGSTNVIFIYNNLLKDGSVMGVVTTPQSDVLSFGGHRGPGLGSMKRFYYGNNRVTTTRMPSPKWYPGVATLPDGRVIVVGGVTRTAATECTSNPTYNNPTYYIYEPDTTFFSSSKPGMERQLKMAWPHVAYPHVTILPDGSISVLAASTVFNYVRCGPKDFCENFRQQDRPHPSWTYPNTGSGTPLPIYPPYTKMEFLAAGGSTNRCPTNFNTPASAKAHVIDLTDRKAKWQRVDDMPFPRLMGDVVQLCDGTIFVANGARSGKAGWCKGPFRYDFKDRPAYNCATFCTCALGWNYEPVIFDPVRKAWSRPGNLAQQRSLRLYHSSAILLPSCKVMIAGSDVTLGNYAEIFSPPYLSPQFGPRPRITKNPANFRTGGGLSANLTVSYALSDPKGRITRALLIRTGTQTHSIQFDARSVWLKVVNPRLDAQRKPSGSSVTVEIPGCSGRPPVGCNIVPPGMYMLVLHTARGAWRRRMARTAAALLLGLVLVLAAPRGSFGEGAKRELQAPAGRGNWQWSTKTDVVMIYANLMKNGGVFGWANGYKGFKGWATVSDWTEQRNGNMYRLPGCGMHGKYAGVCTTAFCSGVALGAKDELFVFGGHLGPGLGTMKRYNHRNDRITTIRMPSPRWYPGTATLPDGRVIVVGGVTRTAATECTSSAEYNNPTYSIYDPATNKMSGDKGGMRAQLRMAWPHVAYPLIIVTPDGGLVVSSGSTLFKYKKCGRGDYCEAFRMQDRPHPAWSYPNTGTGMVLPMKPPYNKMEFLAAGGSSQQCPQNFKTRASAAAHVIELTARRPRWNKIGNMPFPRIMGDPVMLCDGTVLVINGAQAGKAGWCKGPFNYRYKDGGRYNCKTFCTCATGWNYEPVIYNPETGRWSRPDSLAESMGLRLYHSSATLLPNCKVMAAGSDVTKMDRAEIFTPPYYDLGPRPVITQAPDSIRPGIRLTLPYVSVDPIAKVLLLRSGTMTHSTQFDARSLWLKIVDDKRTPAGNTITVEIPGCAGPRDCNVIPPGIYMIVLNTNKGVPSDGKLIAGYGEFERCATVEYYTQGKRSKRILPDCSIHGCTRAFCAGVTTSAKDEIFVLGGHSNSLTERPLETAKLYDHRKGKLQQLDMLSRRWYPGAVTLSDGRVVVVGGVSKTAQAEYGSNKGYNNPTIFDPNTRKFTRDANDMAEKLNRAFPIVAYPLMTVLPDGGLSVAAGNSLCGAGRYCKTWAYRPRPHVPWSYPQTSIGMPLPMAPPYRKLELLATGGVGPMPYPRVMGDAVYLCDGTLLFVNGAQRGRAGWFRGPFRYIYKDSKPWNCDQFCTGATGWNYEPVIFDPATDRWSRPSSLAQQRSLRLYHSTAILLPSCNVMIAGSDGTLGDYFHPSTHALLLRTGSHTHSTQFDARALWLTIVADTPGKTLTLAIPGCAGPRDCNIVPPGMYMLTLSTAKGVPSEGRILSICPDC